MHQRAYTRRSATCKTRDYTKMETLVFVLVLYYVLFLLRTQRASDRRRRACLLLPCSLVSQHLELTGYYLVNDFIPYHTVQFALYIGISPNSQETSCLLHAPVSHGLASTATFTFARVGDDYHVIDTTPTAESGLNSLQPTCVCESAGSGLNPG